MGLVANLVGRAPRLVLVEEADIHVIDFDDPSDLRDDGFEGAANVEMAGKMAGDLEIGVVGAGRIWLRRRVVVEQRRHLRSSSPKDAFGSQ